MKKSYEFKVNPLYFITIEKSGIDAYSTQTGSFNYYSYSPSTISEIRKALKKSRKKQHVVLHACIWHDATIFNNDVRIGCQTFSRKTIQRIIDKYDKRNGRKPTDWSKYGK